MTEATTPGAKVRELTLRAILLGGMIDADVHCGQRLSGAEGRADLRHLDPGRGHLDGAVAPDVGCSTILENNIVQTIASAAGTLAAIIFVLPGLVMVGWWQGFPYWSRPRRSPRLAAFWA